MSRGAQCTLVVMMMKTQNVREDHAIWTNGCGPPNNSKEKLTANLKTGIWSH